MRQEFLLALSSENAWALRRSRMGLRVYGADIDRKI
jgi:hypothetical protein